jgi:hypothetical protein
MVGMADAADANLALELLVIECGRMKQEAFGLSRSGSLPHAPH